MTSGGACALPGNAPRLRNAFGRFGTGVAIVATGAGPHAACAVTVNSFVSLSLDPPLVAFSLSSEARCLPQFRDAAAIAISVLRQDQRRVAANFARPSTARFEGMPLTWSAAGSPVIRGALAVFECVPEQHIVAGDHLIFVMRVTDVHLCNPGLPLLFFSGGYGSFLRDGSDADDAALAMGWG